MKKIFAVFVLILLLCSCTKTENEPFPSEFCADVLITIGDAEYRAVYEKRTDRDKLTFVSPETLSGLEMALNGEVLTVTMGDMTFESEPLKAIFDFLPVASFGTKTVGSRVYTINERSME